MKNFFIGPAWRACRGPRRGGRPWGQSCDFQMVAARPAVKHMSISALSLLEGRFNTSGSVIRRGRPCAAFAYRGVVPTAVFLRPWVETHGYILTPLWGYAQLTTSTCRPAGAVDHRRGANTRSGWGHAMDNAACGLESTPAYYIATHGRKMPIFAPALKCHEHGRIESV